MLVDNKLVTFMVFCNDITPQENIEPMNLSVTLRNLSSCSILPKLFTPQFKSRGQQNEVCGKSIFCKNSVIFTSPTLAIIIIIDEFK
jgi:hypothetical protein